MATGIIFDIKRFSIHDGPGIRSTVFLKGCPLRCAWCHNPESQSIQPELIFRPERCLACGDCVAACPHAAPGFVEGVMTQDWSRCRADGACALACYPGAREMIGREITPDEVIAELVRDRTFYRESGGGVTFSGGEPLAQPDFLEECLRLSKKADLQTALDTCGEAAWDTLERQLPYLDLVLYDLKLIDDRLHQEHTGSSNQRILENFSHLVDSGMKIEVRRPVIPGVNDTPEQIQDLASFLKQKDGIRYIELLPYHSLSADKYRRLGRDGKTWKEPSPDQLNQIKLQLEDSGFEVGFRG